MHLCVYLRVQLQNADSLLHPAVCIRMYRYDCAWTLVRMHACIQCIDFNPQTLRASSWTSTVALSCEGRTMRKRHQTSNILEFTICNQRYCQIQSGPWQLFHDQPRPLGHHNHLNINIRLYHMSCLQQLRMSLKHSAKLSTTVEHVKLQPHLENA